MVEDALNFVKREIRRNNKYDGIILDPPKYGRGPNGENLKIEADLLNLLELIQKLLSPNAIFVVLTSYAIRSSHIWQIPKLPSLIRSRAIFKFLK